MELKNERWDDRRFRATLAEVLAQYPTGREVDLEEVLDYHAGQPGHKNAARAYAAAEREGRTLIQPRAGVATIEGMIELLRYLQEVGGADVLVMTRDAYTRRLDFAEAARGLEESRRTGRSMLNGFPAVIHGVSGVRRVVEAVDRPVCGRGSTCRCELTTAIEIAGGTTEVNGGALAFASCVEAHMPFDEAIERMQFVDRLIGWLAERGLDIFKECSAVISGTLTPPCIAAVSGVIEALLAAEQGVRHLCVTYPLNTTLLQDLAGIRVQRKLCEEYLARGGHPAVRLYQSVNQWLGPCPEDEARTYARICLDSAIAALAGATRLMVKSPQEGFGVPTKEANAAGLRATRQTLDFMRGQAYSPSAEFEGEAALIEREARLILDRIFEFGAGDVAVGTVRAIAAGVLDFPYSVNKHNAGKSLVVRDRQGAVRFLEAGDLPFPSEIREYHRSKIAEAKAGRDVEDYELVLEALRAE